MLLLRRDTGEARGLVVWVGLRCKGRVNSVIIEVGTKINYIYNYMKVFLKYKYMLKHVCTQ